jgi:hypothetical protein
MHWVVALRAPPMITEIQSLNTSNAIILHGAIRGVFFNALPVVRPVAPTVWAPGI